MKYQSLLKFRELELAKSAQKARKEVKGRGMEMIQEAISYLHVAEVWAKLKSDINEAESNLLLMTQFQADDFFQDEETASLNENLTMWREQLADLPSTSFDPQ